MVCLRAQRDLVLVHQLAMVSLKRMASLRRDWDGELR